MMENPVILSDLPKILMVDDRPENLLVLERLLKDHPVELYSATNGNDALKLTLRHDFALALLDIQMPEMDGYELAELLMGEEKTARIPVIFISAIYTDHVNIFEGYKKGAFSYIVKPFEPEILLNKVKLFIDMYEHERELQRRSQELERANRELESFSYSVSHDLKAPLRAINGFIFALQEDYEDKLDDNGKDIISRIRAATERMGFLIEDLLNLSRVSRAEMYFNEVDLGDLAREVMEGLQESAPERNVEIIIDDNLVTRGDRRLLRIIFDNLLGNAWKFTVEKSDARIEVGRTTEASAPVYFVRDNGVGFNMKYAQKLFSPFQRMHEANRFPGTGIGLATVQRVVHKHGGRIWAEAEPDKGATFFFTLGMASTRAMSRKEILSSQPSSA